MAILTLALHMTHADEPSSGPPDTHAALKRLLRRFEPTGPVGVTDIKIRERHEQMKEGRKVL